MYLQCKCCEYPILISAIGHIIYTFLEMPHNTLETNHQLQPKDVSAELKIHVNVADIALGNPNFGWVYKRGSSLPGHPLVT